MATHLEASFPRAWQIVDPCFLAHRHGDALWGIVDHGVQRRRHDLLRPLDFDAVRDPRDDIMWYESDGWEPTHVLCVSTLNILELERI